MQYCSIFQSLFKFILCYHFEKPGKKLSAAPVSILPAHSNQNRTPCISGKQEFFQKYGFWLELPACNCNSTCYI